MDFIYSTINSEIIFKIDFHWNGIRFLVGNYYQIGQAIFILHYMGLNDDVTLNGLVII